MRTNRLFVSLALVALAASGLTPEPVNDNGTLYGIN